MNDLPKNEIEMTGIKKQAEHAAWTKQEAEKLIIGTASSTRIPCYELIPKSALESLANRFELGLERHKERAWNALSENSQTALTKEWLVKRLAHAIDHAYNALAKLHSGADDGEDDAGALMFAGAALAEHLKVQKSLNQNLEAPQGFFVPQYPAPIPAVRPKWIVEKGDVFLMKLLDGEHPVTVTFIGDRSVTYLVQGYQGTNSLPLDDFLATIIRRIS